MGPRPPENARSTSLLNFFSLFLRSLFLYLYLSLTTQSSPHIFLQNLAMNPIVQLSLIFFFLSTVAALNVTDKSPPYCVFHKTCYKDSECGHKGRCVGHLAGKCNCEACVDGRSCTNDIGCGNFAFPVLYIDLHFQED